MIRAFTLWNEPNNLSHWDFEDDPGWADFARMAGYAADELRKVCPDIKLVLGGISPIDANYIKLMAGYGLLDKLDVIGVHGFPLDWNHWKIDEWPGKIAQIEDVSGKEVWVTEVGASSFGADEVQAFGIKRTVELLANMLENVYWYSLMDLPPTWEATTRHKESEGSAYYRHFYMGLLRADGSEKPAMQFYNDRMGLCQWFHFNDPRFEMAVGRLKKMGVRRLRTGISWADWHRPGAMEWFDTQMEALKEFELTITLCFTPPSRGRKACHTSVPVNLEEFGWFCRDVAQRYCTKEKN